MKRVIVESPYAGNVEVNLRYLRACMADCLARGEAPFASHGLYTQPGVLDDTIAEQRAHGIQAGFAWREVADATVVYMDLGISTGMRFGVTDADKLNGPHTHPHRIEYRELGPDWDAGHAEQQRREDLVHIRLRAGLREAIARLEANNCDDETLAPWKALVAP